MNRSAYDRYLSAFNARDYDTVLSFWAASFELSFAGYVFTTPQQVRDFYRFLHHYARESIVVHAYVADEHMAALEATVRLEGLVRLTPEILAEAGYAHLAALEVGQVVEMRQLIHYHLQAGKIVRAVCAVV